MADVENPPNGTTSGGWPLSEMVQSLKEIDLKRKTPKWKKINEEKLRELLSSKPEVLVKTFTKQELQACGSFISEQIEASINITFQNMTKLQFVNVFSLLFGNKSTLSAKKSPKSLKKIVKDVIREKFGKEILNIVFATRSFLEEDLPKWRSDAVFKDGIRTAASSDAITWYCQPEYYHSVNEYVEFLLDCHHLFVNARCYICQNGIDGLGIKKEAWLTVAETKLEKDVGLNIAMVKDVIDRQSNAMAKIMFSENVENRLTELGWETEAQFCNIMRKWYEAEDNPGLDVIERHKARMNMRNLLLDSINLAKFPPPGSHVSGMPVIMFEGILTNIDRRTQMYALVPGNAYNVRAPNSLDAENFFSEFQDLDPKSTGALLADDVPAAIETASYLLHMRLDPNRNFLMRTTKTEKVYPVNALHDTTDTGEPILPNIITDAITYIPQRNHQFDSKLRITRKPKRKSAKVPDIDEPALGTRPVRQFHKIDSSKILPHLRHGLSDI